MATIKDKFKSILNFFGWAQVEATADGIFFSEEQVEKLDTELGSLQTQVKDKDAEIATQKGKVTTAEQKVTDLTTQVTTLTNEKTELQVKLDKAPVVVSPTNTQDNLDTGKTVTSKVTSEAQAAYDKFQSKNKKS